MINDSTISIFIFYNKANGIQSKLAFNKNFKHCNTITYNGFDWILLDFDSTGYLTRRIKFKDASKLIRNLIKMECVSAIVCASVEERNKVAWKPFLIRSCNEVCRYAAGIDVGFTFNPIHLYNKLLKYNEKRNYKILTSWMR